MAEVQNPTKEPPLNGKVTSSEATLSSQAKAKSRPPQNKKTQPLHEIYAQPFPIRTFPLPVFVPSNPLSILHLAYAWIGQIVSPPPAEPSVVYHGVWSAATNSVHVADEKSMTALWQQGFFGKGHLSRSEPNWLKREQGRRGLEADTVSENITAQRRAERMQAKWERARLEQEAIRQTRLEEAQRAAARAEAARANLDVPELLGKPTTYAAPIGPLELLALPNSTSELHSALLSSTALNDLERASATTANGLLTPPILDLVDGDGESALPESVEPNLFKQSLPPKPALSPSSSSDGSEAKPRKRGKSVRFSPTVDSTTFQHSDPPSPNHSFTAPKMNGATAANGSAKSSKDSSTKEDAMLIAKESAAMSSTNGIVNKEHLQLTPEEAFFLVFCLGALSVTDPATGQDMSAQEVFTKFRQFSHFPQQIDSENSELAPDDDFLVHYAVYHHFRSLGWVPRAGIKFGVDWLLYARGPVFDHAEYGLIVIPSYSDELWKAAGKQAPMRPWSWLHSLVRVLAHVTKSLVLVYVDVPPPTKFDEGMEKGFAEALKLYTIREVMVKRWSSNRNR